MNKKISSNRGMESRLRQVLLQQRDAVADILCYSQKFMDQSEQFSTDQLEDLLEHRTGRVHLIEQLEDERHRLMGKNTELEASLRPLYDEIQDALDELAALDNRLKEMIFDAQLRLTNNMAFTPKFINLRQSAANGHYAYNRVLDLMR
ncbi:MAG: hypothetical protein JSU77_07720 [Fidelibacterota bacterium]|nr:MAG: hypothetical protein JSU77_07720 [Candidatus Neomarinimicrobiota bacterium]